MVTAGSMNCAAGGTPRQERTALNDIPPETPAARIRALLALRGWGIPDLCAATGYSRQAVDGHLSGRRSMAGAVQGRAVGARSPVEVYARVLGVPVEVLTATGRWAEILQGPLKESTPPLPLSPATIPRLGPCGAIGFVARPGCAPHRRGGGESKPPHGFTV